MISQGQYESFRQLFFDRITESSNGAEITLKFIDVAYADTVQQFLGEGAQTVDNQYVLKCLYRWMRSDKQREREGVSLDTDIIVYISPLELFNKSGSASIPANFMKAFQKMKIAFLGKEFEIVRVTEVEPMVLQSGVMCIAYQFNLKYVVL